MVIMMKAFLNFAFCDECKEQYYLSISGNVYQLKNGDYVPVTNKRSQNTNRREGKYLPLKVDGQNARLYWEDIEEFGTHAQPVIGR